MHCLVTYGNKNLQIGRLVGEGKKIAININAKSLILQGYGEGKKNVTINVSPKSLILHKYQ